MTCNPDVALNLTKETVEHFNQNGKNCLGFIISDVISFTICTVVKMSFKFRSRGRDDGTEVAMTGLHDTFSRRTS